MNNSDTLMVGAGMMTVAVGIAAIGGLLIGDHPLRAYLSGIGLMTVVIGGIAILGWWQLRA